MSQQVEITRALEPISHRLATADPGLVAQLDTATHTATHTAAIEIARALQRQATRNNSPYAHHIEHDRVTVGVDRKNPFPKACTALIDTPTHIGGPRPSRMDAAHRSDLER